MLSFPSRSSSSSSSSGLIVVPSTRRNVNVEIMEKSHDDSFIIQIQSQCALHIELIFFGYTSITARTGGRERTMLVDDEELDLLQITVPRHPPAAAPRRRPQAAARGLRPPAVIFRTPAEPKQEPRQICLDFVQAMAWEDRKAVHNARFGNEKSTGVHTGRGKEHTYFSLSLPQSLRAIHKKGFSKL